MPKDWKKFYKGSKNAIKRYRNKTVRWGFTLPKSMEVDVKNLAAKRGLSVAGLIYSLLEREVSSDGE